MQYRHRRAHRLVWLLLAGLLPAIGLAALLARSDPAPLLPERLTPPAATR